VKIIQKSLLIINKIEKYQIYQSE